MKLENFYRYDESGSLFIDVDEYEDYCSETESCFDSDSEYDFSETIETGKTCLQNILPSLPSKSVYSDFSDCQFDDPKITNLHFNREESLKSFRQKNTSSRRPGPPRDFASGIREQYGITINPNPQPPTKPKDVIFTSQPPLPVYAGKQSTEIQSPPQPPLMPFHKKGKSKAPTPNIIPTPTTPQQQPIPKPVPLNSPEFLDFVYQLQEKNTDYNLFFEERKKEIKFVDQPTEWFTKSINYREIPHFNDLKSETASIIQRCNADVLSAYLQFTNPVRKLSDTPIKIIYLSQNWIDKLRKNKKMKSFYLFYDDIPYHPDFKEFSFINSYFASSLYDSTNFTYNLFLQYLFKRRGESRILIASHPNQIDQRFRFKINELSLIPIIIDKKCELYYLEMLKNSNIITKIIDFLDIQSFSFKWFKKLGFYLPNIKVLKVKKEFSHFKDYLK